VLEVSEFSCRLNSDDDHHAEVSEATLSPGVNARIRLTADNEQTQTKRDRA